MIKRGHKTKKGGTLTSAGFSNLVASPFLLGSQSKGVPVHPRPTKSLFYTQIKKSPPLRRKMFPNTVVSV
jgi:hypothetical protein